MGTFSLICHPQTPPLGVKSVDVDWDARGDGLVLRYRVVGAGGLVLPAHETPGRHDDLWKATCFELFLGRAGATYQEFNFSPSSRWATYGFADYREGGHDAEMPVAPAIAMTRAGDAAICEVRLTRAILTGADCAGLTAVIEETGGHKSYWALAHGAGRPDFHKRSCFTLQLAAAEAP
ncbi:DOMON-like domain-containing protein [Novosphingobium sp. KACC 22771]|uniref:DOMON-like domain-containing protein n=1 Tax=Novosphingobium sp. KACC 22771 TaxID=3025670 RepID=UPI0023664EBB|nr:DOMON-like domain-containing protein [Novosphingobium sp. KACC 22771]WDF71616.1 DOMON-like domain-containing protein [Novosphingobium sp. KACC 22771]